MAVFLQEMGRGSGVEGSQGFDGGIVGFLGDTGEGVDGSVGKTDVAESGG